MELLPDNLADVLEAIEVPAGPSAATASEALRGLEPSLVLIADEDGLPLFVDPCGSGVGIDTAESLAADLAGRLSERAICRYDVTTEEGPRIAVGARLPERAGRAIFACLIEPWREGVPDDASMARIVAAVTAWAVARHETERIELRTRIEHLLAEQESLKASHSRTLSEAIDERERRLREQEQAQRELRHLHLYNKMILDSAGEGIVGVDRAGSVVFVNPTVERIVGWRAEHLVGKREHAVFHHSDAAGSRYPEEDCPIRMTLSDGVTRRVDHEVFWRNDGTSFPVEYIVTPILESGEITGAVVTFQDITQRRALEGQLVQAQKLESIGQLAAGIAHEINTPTQYIGDNLRFLAEAFGDLAGLLDACDALRKATAEGTPTSALVAQVAAAADEADLDFLADEIPKAVDQSLEGVEGVAKIVRSMKEFSHPGGDEMQSVDLNKALESTLTVCRNEWKYVAEVVTDLDPQLPPVTCLPGECNQVFLNLVINAAHAIGDRLKAEPGEKGTITVRSRRDGDWAEIRISDTGTGIPEKHRSKVFDPFFTTKQVGRGTGQGLAIAHSVVCEKHRGTLCFETEQGKGTTFIVRLPLVTKRPAGEKNA